MGSCLLVLVARLSSLSVSFPCVSLGEKGMRKIPLVTELSVFSKNSELAQVSRKCVIGRYFQLKLLKAKGTEVAQPWIAPSY